MDEKDIRLCDQCKKKQGQYIHKEQLLCNDCKYVAIHKDTVTDRDNGDPDSR